MRTAFTEARTVAPALGTRRAKSVSSGHTKHAPAPGAGSVMDHLTGSSGLPPNGPATQLGEGQAATGLPKRVSDMTATERAIFDAGFALGSSSPTSLLTFDQARHYVKLSAPQFRMLVRQGEIPYGAGGSSPRAWRFSRIVLDAWAAGRTAHLPGQV